MKAANDPADVAWAYVISSGDIHLLHGPRQTVNLFHLLNRKFGLVLPLSNGRIVATLRNHIQRVLLRRSRKKMVRVDAKLVVASVAHIHAGRNVTNKCPVGKFVRADGLAIEPEHPVSATAASKENASILRMGSKFLEARYVGVCRLFHAGIIGVSACRV